MLFAHDPPPPDPCRNPVELVSAIWLHNSEVEMRKRRTQRQVSGSRAVVTESQRLREGTTAFDDDSWRLTRENDERYGAREKAMSEGLVKDGVKGR